MNKILVISGSTASGKSKLAIEINKITAIAIINADSLQIYEGLPLLSAQPNLCEQELVPHFLYSALKFTQKCCVATWLRMIKSAIDKAHKDGLLPVIVGGSGMYIDKLINGICEIPEISQETKEKALSLYQEFGHEKFEIEFGNNKILDPQRLLRAAEVFIQTGKPISFWQQQENKKLYPKHNFLHINLTPDRADLYQRCNKRFSEMLDGGAIDEVSNLIKKINSIQSLPIDSDYQITKTLGFYEIKDHLENKISRQEMIDLATQKTRNYAKRQLTWFRNQFVDKITFENQVEAYNFIKNEIC